MSVRADGWCAVEDVFELCNHDLCAVATVRALARYHTLCRQSVRKSAARLSAMCVSGVSHCPALLLCFRVRWELLLLGSCTLTKHQENTAYELTIKGVRSDVRFN